MSTVAAHIAWIVGFVFAAVVYYVGARLGLAAAPRPRGEHAVLTGKRAG